VFSVKIGGEEYGLCDVKFWCLSVDVVEKCTIVSTRSSWRWRFWFSIQL
jgi:hypothetical protein